MSIHPPRTLAARLLGGLLLLAAVAACSTAPTSSGTETAPSQAFGIDLTGKRIVFVLDVSGSMEYKDEVSPSGVVYSRARDAVTAKLPDYVRGMVGAEIDKRTTKLAAARRALADGINLLDNSRHFQIVLFSNAVKDWQREPVKATAENKAAAIRFLDGLATNGGTSAKAALEHAMRIPGVDQMVFISDGRPTDAKSDLILKSVQAANARKGVKIYAVGLGDDQDKEFMEALAAQNRGSYVRRSGLF